MGGDCVCCCGGVRKVEVVVVGVGGSCDVRGRKHRPDQGRRSKSMNSVTVFTISSFCVVSSSSVGLSAIVINFLKRLLPASQLYILLLLLGHRNCHVIDYEL